MKNFNRDFNRARKMHTAFGIGVSVFIAVIFALIVVTAIRNAFNPNVTLTSNGPVEQTCIGGFVHIISPIGTTQQVFDEHGPIRCK